MRSTLRQRLDQRRGSPKGSGNHRGSIFRLRVAERPVEEAVSRYIGMPFLWLDIGDDPGPESERVYIERNAIALLSNHGRPPLDPHSTEWLGQHSDRALVTGSGLWNQRHVTETHEAEFLATLSGIVNRTA